MDEKKMYVDIFAEFTKEGRLVPKSIKWQDGTVYEIEKIKDVRRTVSLKAGGAGTRYTCMIWGKEKHLFYEDNNKWFVELK